MKAALLQLYITLSMRYRFLSEKYTILTLSANCNNQMLASDDSGIVDSPMTDLFESLRLAHGMKTRPCQKYIASRYFYGCKRPCTRTQCQTLLCKTVYSPKRDCYQYSDLATQYVFRGYSSLKFENLDRNEEC